jgi:hypothetical protein
MSSGQTYRDKYARSGGVSPPLLGMENRPGKPCMMTSSNRLYKDETYPASEIRRETVKRRERKKETMKRKEIFKNK